MAFKDIWKPRVDGVDDADSSAVNEIAEEVIRQADEETNIKQSINGINKDVKTLQDDMNNLKENPTVPTIDAYAKQEANNLFANAIKKNLFLSGETIDDVSPIQHDIIVNVTAPDSIYVDVSDFGILNVGGLTVEATQNGITVSGITNGEEMLAAGYIASYTLNAGVYTFGFIGDLLVKDLPNLLSVHFNIYSVDTSGLIEEIIFGSDSSMYVNRSFEEPVEVTITISISNNIQNPISGVNVNNTFFPIINRGLEQIIPVDFVQYVVVGDNSSSVDFYYGSMVDRFTYQAIVKPMYPQMVVGSTPGIGYVYEVIYNRDATKVIDNLEKTVGKFDKALDTIIAQQESIIEIQNGLIGGDTD